MADNTVVHQRFKTFVKVFYVLSYIPLALMALFSLILVVAIAAVPFIPLNSIEERLINLPVTGVYESTGLTFEITEAYLQTITLDQTMIILTLVAQFFFILGIGLVTFFINRWLRNIKNGDIFTVRNSRFIELAGYTLIILTVLEALAEFTVSNLLASTFAVTEITNELNSQLSFGFSENTIEFNLMILFSGIIVWILARVFKYGAFLQEEYDGTV